LSRIFLPDKGISQALEGIYPARTLQPTEDRNTLRHCNNQKHPHTSLKAPQGIRAALAERGET